MTVTFTRAAFEATLDDLGERLGDLWAVDEVLKRTRRTTTRSPGVCVRVGWKHPFDVMVYVEASVDPEGPLPVVDHGAVQREVDALGHLGAAWGRAVAASVREAVDALVRPLPAAFDEAVEVLRTDLVGPLSTEIADDFAHVGSLSEWSGEAADDFALDTYGPMELCVRNQAAAAQGMCIGLAGAKAVVDLGQHSLMGLVTAAAERVDEQLRERAATHGTGSSPGAGWLVLAATFAALVGALPTGGLSLGAVAVASADTAGILLSYASSSVPDGDEVTFTSTSAGDAAEELARGIALITERVDRHWSELAEVTAQLERSVQAARDEHRLAPRRPGLMLDGPVTPRLWHHATAPR